MQRRKFSRKFKLETVKLVRKRGVSVSQAARDLDLHENVLRKRVREQAADPGSAFPGHGVMKPARQEIERLRRKLARMKAKRDMLKKRQPTSPGTRYEVRVHREAPWNLAGVVYLRSARCFAQRLSHLAGSSTQCACPERCGLSIGVQKGPPIGVQKGPRLSSGVTGMAGVPFALVAA